MAEAAIATTAAQQATPPEDSWTETVCKIGHGAQCCRYLTMSARGWCCEKNTDLAAVIDARVAAGTFTARGDNCDGRGQS